MYLSSQCFLETPHKTLNFQEKSLQGGGTFVLFFSVLSIAQYARDLPESALMVTITE